MQGFDEMIVFVTLGRILLGASFALDGAWWLWTWDVRAAYLEDAGAPSLVIPVIAAVYLVAGTLLALGRAARPCILALVAVVGLITMFVHTDLGPGGIGEYPMDAHARLNTNALLLQVGLAGSLMLAFAAPNSALLPDPRTVVLGRSLMGTYFLAHGLYLALYFETIVENLADGSAGTALLVAAIGIQIVFGLLLASARSPRATSMVLALVVIVSTLTIPASVSGLTNSIEVRVHEWFVGASLLAGLWIVFGLGPAATPVPPPQTKPG